MTIKRLKYYLVILLFIVISPFMFIHCETSVSEEGLADLLYIGLSAGTITPDFDPDVTAYTVTVPEEIESITVTVITKKNVSSLKLNDIDIISGEESYSIDLIKGNNNILTVKVTGTDGTVKTYTITVDRTSASKNANLKNLSIPGITLSPSFNTQVFSYSALVTTDVHSVDVIATVEDENASITINGIEGATASDIPLSLGENIISIAVTSEDGSMSNVYTVTITQSYAGNESTLSALALSQSTLTPGFIADVTSYTTSVANEIDSITVTPTASSTESSITVNGTAVTSGTASAAIPLIIGDNTITIIVTSVDGTATSTYTITVNRLHPGNESRLSTLTISQGTLNPVFGQDTATYAVPVAYGVTSLTVTPTTVVPSASIIINESVVLSGTPSGVINLNTGDNTITIVVTGTDGITKTNYTITVTRALPLIGLSPANVMVTSTEGTNATLGWDALSSAPTGSLLGYNVYRSSVSGGTYEKVNSAVITTTTYEVTGNLLVNNLTVPTYYYVVRAVDTEQNESVNSAETSATFYQKIYVPDNNFNNKRLIEIDTIPRTTWKSSLDNAIPNYGIQGDCPLDIRGVDFDRQGKIYFIHKGCSNQGGLYQITAITDDSATQLVVNDTVRTLAIDRVNNLIYFGDVNTLSNNLSKIYMYNIANQTTTELNIVMQNVWSMAVDEEGILLLGGMYLTSPSIVKYNAATDTVLDTYSSRSLLSTMPSGIKIEGSSVFVLDYGNGYVLQFNKADLSYVQTIGSPSETLDPQESRLFRFYGPTRFVGILSGKTIIADYIDSLTPSHSRLLTFTSFTSTGDWFVYGDEGTGVDEFHFYIGNTGGGGGVKEAL